MGDACGGILQVPFCEYPEHTFEASPWRDFGSEENLRHARTDAEESVTVLILLVGGPTMA